jgi:hypothetical protein
MPQPVTASQRLSPNQQWLMAPQPVPWQIALFAQNSNGEAGYVCSGTLSDAQWVVDGHALL